MPKVVKEYLKIGAPIFTAMITLLVIESLAQVEASVLVPDARCNSMPDDELAYVRTGGNVYRNNIFLRFNDLGLRGGDVKAGKVATMILGNSVTLAYDIPEENTFASLLAAVNAGEDGYNTVMERKRYLRDLYRLEPKKLIIVITPADVITEEDAISNARHIASQSQCTMLHGPFRGEGFYRFYLWRRTDTQRDISQQAIERLLGFVGIGKSLSLSGNETQEDKDKEYMGYVTNERPKKMWDDWAENLLLIRDASPNTRLYVVFSPSRSQVRAYQNGTRDFWLNTKLSEFCRQNNILFLDLLPTMAEHDVNEVYRDFIHYNEKGHSVVAHDISKFIEGA